MSLIVKPGLDMQLPDGKIPGFYAQIVKGIAERVELFDRYKELLVLESEQDIPPILELLEHYRVGAEPARILVAPKDSLMKGPLFDDYAIVTNAGRTLFDVAQTAAFSLHMQKPDGEPAPALQQLDEHLIGSVDDEDGEDGRVVRAHLLDRQLTELAERIAAAYGCFVRWRL